MDQRLADPIALWVSPVAELGGVARHLLDVARVGVPGWRVVFFCPEGPLAAELRLLGAPVLVGRFGPDVDLRTSLTSLRDAVRRLCPAIVHTHLSYADVAAALATVGLPTALVTTEHGIAADDLVYHGTKARSAAKALVHTARLRRFDAVIAVSDATRTAMAAKWHPRQPITVIPNGVDPLDAAAPSEPGLRFASIARLAPEKRLGDLLRAFAQLRATHPAATLTVAGTGPLAGQLRQDAVRLGIADAVSFPGYVQAPAVLAETDVLVQLSVWENCSYSLLDAVAHGRGVVASGVGGNPEILPSRCLADPDDPSAVAAAMAEQGLQSERRPVLKPGWPTVAAMAARIAEVYAPWR